MRKLVYPLSQKAGYYLSDNHLWYSIFIRPLATKFTHVQRCVCSFVLLFTAMLLNILYYDQIEDVKNEAKINGLSFGPFYLAKEQVFLFLSL
jgi:hypothetical protein